MFKNPRRKKYSMATAILDTLMILIGLATNVGLWLVVIVVREIYMHPSKTSKA